MRVLRYWRLGLGAALALSAGVVFAADPAVPSYPECTKKPTPQDLDGAKGAHKAATQFYDRGDYDKAVRYWNDALGFDCTANDLLINIGNAYEKQGDRVAAAATFEAYLKRTGPNPTIEEKVKNLHVLIAVGAATTATPTAAPAVTAAPTVTAAPVTPPASTHPYGNAPWFVVGGGGALAIVGAILLPVGYSGISSANSQCVMRVCNSSSAISQGNAGRAEAGAGWGLLTIGALAVAGGLGWQLALNKPKPAADAPPPKAGLWVSPTAGPGQAGVTVGGAF
jgi:tetratricopeptide (TPR) repeat protein